MRLLSRLLPFAATLLLLPGANAQSSAEWGARPNGTYANPIIPADVSDLDVIRVGDRFLAITSTFQYSPGMAVLESHDLVNWHILSHVVPDLNRISPAMNWDQMARPGRGIWAGAIRFHANRYWVYFGTPDEGLFASSAPDPTGPWTPVALVVAEKGWDDPCPFWDDDGQGYLVTTRYAADPANGKTYNIHLFKLGASSTSIEPGFDRILHQSRGSEANKLYKIHGLYFHYYSEVAPEGRVAMMERSPSLAGPWETHQLLHVHAAVDKEPNQGGLIELPSGQWWFFTHQGKGDWEGRAGVLLPVTWKDNWPILGRVGDDGIGNMLWQGPVPVPGLPPLSLAASDDFSAPTLKPEWEWNYQPQPGMWSLTERPGFLRLRAFPTLRPADFRSTGDVLTQRAQRTAHNEVTAKLDLAGLVDGQQAGLAHYARTFAALTVQQADSRRLLFVQTSAPASPKPIGLALTAPVVWLRSTWNIDGLSHFSYSTDGKSFTPIGDPYPLTWGNYRGDRIALFTSGSGGVLDIDDFRYEIAR